MSAAPATQRPIPFTRFCERVLRLDLTPGQRVLTCVAFDEVDPIDVEEALRPLALEMFGGAERVPPSARRTHVWRLGRGSGKSLLAAARCAYRMVTADLSECGPGDEPTALVIAPEMRLSQIAFKAGRACIRQSPFLRPLIVRETASTITIRRPDGREATFMTVPKSAGGRAARGRSLIEVLFDESEFMPAADPTAAIQDGEVIDAVYPRLLPGGAVILSSTPWPAPSRTADLFGENFGKPLHALVARATTLMLRPIPRLEADRAALMAVDPNKALREYDCVITDADGALFEATTIDRAVSPSITPRRARTTAGIDLAFRADASALIITERQDERLVVVHFRLLTPKPGKPLKPSEVMAQFAREAKEYGATEFVADSHYIESARENAELAGMAVASGPGDKEASFLYVRSLLREQKLDLPLNMQLLGQMKSVLGIPKPGGGLNIVLPRRQGAGHADLVSALVAAAHHDRRFGPLLRSPTPPQVPRGIPAGFQWK